MEKVSGICEVSRVERVNELTQSIVLMDTAQEMNEVVVVWGAVLSDFFNLFHRLAHWSMGILMILIMGILMSILIVVSVSCWC